MKKKYDYLYLLIFCFCTIGYAQEIEVTEVIYKFIPAKAVKELTQKQEKIRANYEQLRASFVFNKHYAKYQNLSDESLYSDIDYFVASLQFGPTLLFNLQQKNEFLFEPNNDEFYFKIKTNNKEWKLTNEHKNINGIKCYKAELIEKRSQYVRNSGKREFYVNITAWYAPIYPIMVGYNQNNGLPGLIMQFEDGDTGSLVVESISKKNVSEDYFLVPKKYTVRTDYEEYINNLGKAFEKNYK